MNTRVLSRYLLTLTLLAPAVPAAAAPPSRAAAAADAISRIHIDNFGRVSNTYFRGAQPQGHDFADLAAAGVKTIINLTSDDASATESAMTQAAGMKYVQIPMTTHTVPTPAQIAEFLHIVSDPASQPVYVHCVGGRHRTGVMTAIYRMAVDGWSPAAAFAEMKQYKFGADFLHAEFKDFVLAYHPVTSTASTAAPAAKIGG